MTSLANVRVATGEVFTKHRGWRPRHTRFVNVFGKREMEQAAIFLHDHGLLDRGFTAADVSAMDRDEQDGLRMLERGGYVQPQWGTRRRVLRASETFVRKCREAQARDEVS